MTKRPVTPMTLLEEDAYGADARLYQVRVLPQQMQTHYPQVSTTVKSKSCDEDEKYFIVSVNKFKPFRED